MRKILHREVLGNWLHGKGLQEQNAWRYRRNQTVENNGQFLWMSNSKAIGSVNQPLEPYPLCKFFDKVTHQVSLLEITVGPEGCEIWGCQMWVIRNFMIQEGRYSRALNGHRARDAMPPK